jgi:hypothetical protein
MWVEIGIHADIDHPQPAAMESREDARRCTAAQEIANHLCGDDAGEGAHPLVADPMVRCEQQQLGLRDFGVQIALDHAQLDDQILETAERALRLGQPIESRPD